MAQTKQQKVNKDIAEMLLRIQGVDYHNWLDEKHVDVISKGTDTMKKLSEIASNNLNKNATESEV